MAKKTVRGKRASSGTGASKPGDARRFGSAVGTTREPQAHAQQVHAVGLPAVDLRHTDAKRKNNPPALIAAEGTVPIIAKAKYEYNPHLPPVLRFDQHGKADTLPDLLAKARKGPLSSEEVAVLDAALKNHAPWLEWTGKREKKSFEVDPVALHIHERVSTRAILKVAARQDVTRDLFADPEQEYHQAVQFYRHDVDWANRLILGDSLQVMSSLARREDLAGKVQMIYMDPPYGIKFASNFQPEVGKRDVKDKQEDLTREPEMVRAYRDTWHLGIHSYLSYLRDRLIVARELLADTGSIFVQISDENLHLVRNLLDEVFGNNQLCSVITVWKTSSATSSLLPTTSDYLLWYARDISKTRYRQTYLEKDPADPSSGGAEYKFAETPLGERRPVSQLTPEERRNAALFRPSPTTSQSGSESTRMPVNLAGRSFWPGPGGWKTNASGFERLTRAERLMPRDQSISYVRFLLDFPVAPVSNLWTDVRWGFDAAEKRYVVETNPGVIERCLLMTTDPGDLVLDPTCGSGTTAYVAEQWGRRWITTDTSRVAIAIARQRVLTAKFDHYKTRQSGSGHPASGVRHFEEVVNPSAGFRYKTVPHVTLKSIAQNVALDPIFAKHEPVLERAIEVANSALAKVDAELRARLCEKYAAQAAKDGLSSLTDADARRWLLPKTTRDQIDMAMDRAFRKAGKKPPTAKQIGAAFEQVPTRAQVGASHVPSNGNGWEHWQVPFDTDGDWPKGLADAVTAYRAAWRAKMDEVNACIAASAEQEELVDQPEVVKGITRVSGPFTVEGVQPAEMTLGDEMSLGERGVFGGEPEEMATGFTTPREVVGRNELEVANVSAYLDQMYRFLKADGVRFLGNKQMRWTRLDSLSGAGTTSPFHAEGRWAEVGKQDTDPEGKSNVAVAFGPQYGPITSQMVVLLMRAALKRGYDHLVLAGFNFDGAAQAEVDNQPNAHLKIHMAHIRPDINPGMEGLLKESVTPGGGQLFTVFGQPRIRIASDPSQSGTKQFTVTMEGVDVYNPVDDSVASTGASKVAAWFLDSDYDGTTFCITQAFFPDRSAWEKLQKALNGKGGPIDAERFEALSGTTSLPFPAGDHGRVAVKVIDPRGNEAMVVEKLEQGGTR